MSVVMHQCVCLYVCSCMGKNLYLCETPIYFRHIYYLINILLCRVSQGETAYAIKLWFKYLEYKGGLSKWVLPLFWWVQTFGLLLFDSMLFLWTQF